MNVIIHCSASKFGNAILIDSWHRQRGWNGIGYHAVILNGWITSKLHNKHFDGLIESGRPFDDSNLIDPFELGAHTAGHNDTIGVCLIGNSGEFTHNQLQGLNKFLEWMRSIFGPLTISQHSDWDKKKPLCAGLSKEFLEHLNNAYG